MPNEFCYIGLDIAMNLGLAILYTNSKVIKVKEITGTPNKQLDYITNEVLSTVSVKLRPIFVSEGLHNFRNANTVRSLCERMGYIKYSLIGAGFKFIEVAPRVARAYLKTSSKTETFDFFVPRYTGTNLTNNHTDAIAVVLYQMHQGRPTPNLSTYTIEDF